MEISITLHYLTAPGEKLLLVSPQLEEKSIQLIDSGGGYKSVSLSLPDHIDSFNYHFKAIDAEGTVRREFHDYRHLKLSPDLDSLSIHEQWRDRTADAPLYSSAFINSIAARHSADPIVTISPSTFTIELRATMIPQGRTLAITGNCDLLGNWNPDKALPLNDSGYPLWKISLPLEQLPDYFEWKFVELDTNTRELIRWQPGENHTFHITARKSSIYVASLYLPAPLPLWRGAGVAIPVFSLRTPADYGCGDFRSLLHIIDWAAETGQNFVQILPINDTCMTGTKADSYPYNAISSFALHPMYIHPDSIGTISDRELRQKFEYERLKLNALPMVDYEAVMRLKMEILQHLFSQHGASDLASADFKRFFNDNASWLQPYAAYCILRDIHTTADFSKWGEYAVYNPESVARLLARHRLQRDFVFFTQYHLDKQLHKASNHAHSRGVNLKGDLPIGISRNSVEAWLAPELYNLDSSAGAPPDDFSATGQNWGFPTYNWEQMALDGYNWWKTRFRKMADYFDAYRIDHLLGFFRIWQMPASCVRGLTGTFYPALPFSPDELLNRFGFRFDPEIHARPYLTTEILNSALKEYPDAVNRFFQRRTDNPDLWQFRPEYATQRMIENKLSHKQDSLKKILFSLSENLLFLPDPTRSGLYHPRIAAHETKAFEALSPDQQKAFRILHEDFFYKRHNDFWRCSAMKKLPPLIDATSMLACAEDLGMIPGCVPGVMEDLRLLSLEVQRMPKQFGHTFGNPADYPWLSVGTTSTHDMAPLRLWWRQSPELTNRFFSEILHRKESTPIDADCDICYQILCDIMRSPAMLAIIPLQDWLSVSDRLRNPDPTAEQINNPADPNHYWRYRMHIDVDTIRADQSFNDKVRALIALRK